LLHVKIVKSIVTKALVLISAILFATDIANSFSQLLLTSLVNTNYLQYSIAISLWSKGQTRPWLECNLSAANKSQTCHRQVETLGSFLQQ